MQWNVAMVSADRPSVGRAWQRESQLYSVRIELLNVASSVYRVALNLGNNIGSGETVLSRGPRIEAVTIYGRPSIPQLDSSNGQGEIVSASCSPSIVSSTRQQSGAKSEGLAVEAKSLPHDVTSPGVVRLDDARYALPDAGLSNAPTDDAHPNPTPTSLSKLKSLLSPSAGSPSAYIHPTTVRSLYMSVKARSQLHKLTAADMSILMNLFGSLSLSTPDQTYHGAFAYPVSASSRASKERSHWSFLIRIATDKQRVHKGLAPSDHYWVMLARLAETVLSEEQDHAKCFRSKWAMDEARTHYAQVGRSCSHLDIHVRFLQGLLRRPTPDRLDEVSRVLSTQVKLRGGLHPHLWSLVWRTLINRDLASRSRDRLVSSIRALAERSSALPSHRADATSSDGSREVSEDVPMSRREIDYANINELPDALARVVYPLPKAPRIEASGDELSSWACQTARSLLTSKQVSLDTVFKRLLLLTVSRRRSTGISLAEVPFTFHGDLLRDEGTDWVAACVLSLLEGLLNGDAGRVYVPPNQARSTPKHLPRILDTMWKSWASSDSWMSGEPLVPSLIVASFIYIAGRIGHYDLVRACTALLARMPGRQEGDPSYAVAMHWTTVEYVIASVACNFRLETVFRIVAEHVKDHDLLSHIINNSVTRIAKADPVLACEAAKLAEQIQVSISPTVLTSAAINLVAHGHVWRALLYVEDHRLDRMQQSQVLLAVLKGLNVLCYPPPLHSAPPLAGFTGLLSQHALEPLVRRELKQLLLSSAAYGDSARAVAIIQRLQASHPTYFGRSFLLTIRRHLVDRRQSRLILSLMRCLPRRKDPRSRTNGCRNDGPVDASAGVAVPRALKTSSQPTAIAPYNKLLHRHLLYKASRHAQRVEEMRVLLLRMIFKDGVSADRVTTNIIVKALLRWTHVVDKTRVRALFDQLVRRGYPTGGLYPEGAGPFGCTLELSTPLHGLSFPDVKSPIEFAKHVRPLYKMFITGLRMRKDHQGARIVTNILRALTQQDVRERMEQEEIRFPSLPSRMSVAQPGLSSQATLIGSEDPMNPEKALKRKFEEAIHNLDTAVGPSTLDVPSSAKRPKMTRTLYSTLAKYGIKKEAKSNADSVSRMDSIAKNAPHLVAILTRAASRTRKPVPFKHANSPSLSTQSSTSPGSDYRPSSITSFISRLATFKLTTYANKPPAIDAVAAAKCGWINDGKDRLICGICNASWVVAGTSGMNRDAANALVEKQKGYLVEMHKDGCPWKSRQCDPSIYHVPLQMPAAMIRELKTRAMKLHLVMKDVQIKHPLTTSQMQQFFSVMRSTKAHSEPDPLVAATSPPPTSGGVAPLLVDDILERELSETAMLTALFGWSIVLPTPSEPPRRSSGSGGTC
ncbi:hypothetical protein NM688_g110 [Phlebia brevispora]|uniref:Uncharacterized protein n=1 Tax=Phlebia brevispora TaxID=194682 RepID=A0ACC1TFL2_9APHY|nr:hypothetical protein NM688_g110 [Phlebia brevispora]